MGRTPQYYFVAFGSAHINQSIDGGSYGHRSGFIENSNVSPGDVMLLYCTKGYLGHHQEAPGIGVVTGVELDGTRGVINFQYFPLDHPLSLDSAKSAIPELKDNTNFGFRGNWLRKIASSSFRAALTDKLIDWP